VPERIQLRRTRGWRKPDGAVVVARPSRWGNPFRIGPEQDRERAVARFRAGIEARAKGRRTPPELRGYPSDEEIRTQLAGRDLACWCPKPGPCHADVLLEVANR
jgi:hypothetical protein